MSCFGHARRGPPARGLGGRWWTGSVMGWWCVEVEPPDPYAGKGSRWMVQCPRWMVDRGVEEEGGNVVAGQCPRCCVDGDRWGGCWAVVDGGVVRGRVDGGGRCSALTTWRAGTAQPPPGWSRSIRFVQVVMFAMLGWFELRRDAQTLLSRTSVRSYVFLFACSCELFALVR